MNQTNQNLPNNQSGQGGMPPPPPNNQDQVQPQPTPFEMPQGSNRTQQPDQQPSGGGKKWILYILLIIFIVLAGLVFASWFGWVSLGGLEKYWGGGKKETTDNTETIATPESRDAQRKRDLQNVKTALKNYYKTNQVFPNSVTVTKTVDPDSKLNVLTPNYIQELPIDPLSPTYYYGYTSDGASFTLTAALEVQTDPSGIKSGNFLLYKVTDTSVESPA